MFYLNLFYCINFFLHFPSGPASPNEYLITAELSISDIVVLNELRAFLSNMTDPISISDYILIFDINITTGMCEHSTHTCAALTLYVVFLK